MYYDIHCHLFNKDFLVKELLYRLFIEIKKLVSAEYPKQRGLIPDNFKKKLRALKRIAGFLKTGFKQDSASIYDELCSLYQDQDFIITPLMFDLTWCFSSSADRAHIDGNMIVEMIETELARSFRDKRRNVAGIDQDLQIKIDEQLDEIKQILSDWKNVEQLQPQTRSLFDSFALPGPEDGFNEQIRQLVKLKYTGNNECKIYPFLAVDPRREGILEYAKTNTGPGKLFAGIKLYTPNGYSPTDPLLFGTNSDNDCLYSFCEKNNIPVTVHNSFGGFATLAKKVKVTGHVWLDNHAVYLENAFLEFKTQIIKGNIAVEERADKLNNPSLWEIVANKYPQLHLNLAHLGGGNELLKALDSPTDGQLWSNKIISLITNPALNVYTDISCMGTDDLNALRKLRQHNEYEKIKTKLLYGSDFYLCKLFDDNLGRTLKKFKKIFDTDFQIIADHNPAQFLGSIIIKATEVFEEHRSTSN